MPIETIDAAILAHRNWVARFNTKRSGISTEVFDLNKAGDDSGCEFGKWLNSDSALQHLGPQSHARIKALHATFHEIAGDLAGRLNRLDIDEGTQNLMYEFDNLSRQLVQLLMQAKRNG